MAAARKKKKQKHFQQIYAILFELNDILIALDNNISLPIKTK